MKYARTTATAVLALIIMAVMATTTALNYSHGHQDNTTAGGLSTTGLPSQRANDNPNPTPEKLPLPVGVEAWRWASFNGTGVKVGIIDSSFANIGSHLTAATDADNTTDRHATDNIRANCESPAESDQIGDPEHGTSRSTATLCHKTRNPDLPRGQMATRQQTHDRLVATANRS